MHGNKIEKQQFKDIKLQDFISIVLFFKCQAGLDKNYLPEVFCQILLMQVDDCMNCGVAFQLDNFF